MRALLSLAFTLCTLACGNRSVGTTPSPDEGPTLRVWKEDLEDNSNSTLIWAENLGKLPVVVTQVRVYSCANLYQTCGMHTPNVRIEPGQQVRVARFDPSDHSARPRFGYEYQWRAIRPATTPPTDGTMTAVITRNGVSSTLAPIAVDRWRALVAPVAVDGRCMPLAPPAGEGRMLSMQFGPPGSRPIRMVLVGLDAGGRIVSVNDSRGDMRVSIPSSPAQVAVSDPGPRTTMSVDVLRGTALLINQPPGGEVEQHHATATNLLDALSLGPLRPIAEQVVRECGSE